MNLARSVADVLAEHVTFEVECIDRMYCNVYVPQIAVRRRLGRLRPQATRPTHCFDRTVGGDHRPVRLSDPQVRSGERISWVDFVKGQRKDDVLHEQLKVFETSGQTEGVVFIGRAQEKTNLFRTEKRRNAAGHAYPWIVRSTGVVNHFYFYCLDEDFGPFFVKFCSYFPYTAKLCLNGHHWAQRQAAKRGSGSPPWTTRSPPWRTRPRCSRSVTGWARRRSRRLLDKWLAILPNPFTDADRAAGYRYQTVDPAGRVLSDPDARRPGHRPDLLRTRHPRQPRCRPRRTRSA